MALKILYFASLRESIGVAEEHLQPSADVHNIKELITWLSKQSKAHASAFKNHAQIHVALDQTHSSHETSIKGVKEIAFFPPVTGG
jgi:molybdopterin synthase sulfur carrier subunit